MKGYSIYASLFVCKTIARHLTQFLDLLGINARKCECQWGSCAQVVRREAALDI